jgi:hypothetical protein
MNKDERIAFLEKELEGEREHVRNYVAELDRKTREEFYNKNTSPIGWRCLVYNCISILKQKNK